MSVDVKSTKNSLQDMLNKIDYESLSGRGGAFLVTPLDKFKISNIFIGCREIKFPQNTPYAPSFFLE